MNRRELEDIYRNRLQEARAAYAKASDELRTVRLDLHLDAIPEPDGSLAYRHALVAERMALRAFHKAILDFNGLILDGRIPQDAL